MISRINEYQLKTNNNPSNNTLLGIDNNKLSWVTTSGIADNSNFTDLLDTPTTYSGYAGYFPRVDNSEIELLFSQLAAGSGISISGVTDLDISVDQTFSFSWTNTHKWSVPTLTKQAIVLQSTDDNDTNNLFEIWKSDNTLFGGFDRLGRPFSTLGVDSNSYFAGGAGNTGITGVNNVGIGHGSLASLTSGSYNFAMASNAMVSATTLAYSLALGRNAMSTVETGDYNIAIGANSMSNTGTYIRYNTGIGASTLQNAENNYNTAIGTFNLGNVTTGYNNLAIGYYVGHSLTTGSNNTFIGSNAGNSLTTEIYNTAIGVNAMSNATGIAQSIAIGQSSADNKIGGIYGIYIGQSAGQDSGAAGSQIAIGFGSLQNNTSTYATGIGRGAGVRSTNNGITIGAYAGRQANINASVITGYFSAYTTTDASYSVILGHNALVNGTGGKSSVIIGFAAGYNADGTGNVFIGYQAGYSETGSNKLYIANSSTSTPLIYGEFSNSLLRFNSEKVEIRSTDAFYFGDATVDGTWRIIRDGNDLSFERRESGSWIAKTVMTA